MQHTRDDSLDNCKAVADARVRASNECKQIAEDAGDGLNSLRNGFPAFWSAGTVKKLNEDASGG
jgi:hypothetical protein